MARQHLFGLEIRRASFVPCFGIYLQILIFTVLNASHTARDTEDKIKKMWDAQGRMSIILATTAVLNLAAIASRNPVQPVPFLTLHRYLTPAILAIGFLQALGFIIARSVIFNCEAGECSDCSVVAQYTADSLQLFFLTVLNCLYWIKVPLTPVLLAFPQANNDVLSWLNDNHADQPFHQA